MPTKKIVFLRHGESTWNEQNLFTGWVDVDLTEKGRQEALRAGRLLREAGFAFDGAYTSVLKRAILTLWLALEAMDQCWLPVQKHWRLNERHYGALQGKNKAQAAEKYGDKQVQLWRRSYDIKPPLIDKEEAQKQCSGPYVGVPMPTGECLKDTIERVLPYWHETIAPKIAAGKTLLLSAHGNSLRALIMYLDHISEQDIPNLNIPNGIPLVYEFDEALKPKNHYYLGQQ